MSDNDKVQRSTPYPLRTLSPVIKPENITQYKHLQAKTLNHYVKKEYDRLMEQAALIMRQLNDLEQRVQITELIENSKYRFKPIPGNIYHLYHTTAKYPYVLSLYGRDDWAAGIPLSHEWVADVQKLGDSTWEVIEVSETYESLFPKKS
tara:strand:+ start:152 stop:598 length:447 start_codon:yes stop_codon:yes gene_type:complete